MNPVDWLYWACSHVFSTTTALVPLPSFFRLCFRLWVAASMRGTAPYRWELYQQAQEEVASTDLLWVQWAKMRNQPGPAFCNSSNNYSCDIVVICILLIFALLINLLLILLDILDGLKNSSNILSSFLHCCISCLGIVIFAVDFFLP